MGQQGPITIELTADQVASVLKQHAEPPAEPATPVAIVPAAPAPAIGVTFTQDANGYRVDDPAPPGTPGTRTMPKTGHVLSDPLPDKGETISGYFYRTCKQTGGDPSAEAALGYLASGLKSYRGGVPDAWPETCDEFANRNAYT